MPQPTPLANKPKLMAAIEQLYRAFDGERPSTIAGCPCCIDTRKVDVLIATPRRDLTGEQLWRYISGAYLTIGSDRDFRYLMPRIFELAVLKCYEVPDTEIVLGKLTRARWLSWPAAERAAILAFIDVWLDVAIEQDKAQADEDRFGDLTDSLLCGVALAGLPIEDWLTRLTKPANEPLLADMRRRHPEHFSSFWNDAPHRFSELMAFLNNG